MVHERHLGIFQQVSLRTKDKQTDREFCYHFSMQRASVGCSVTDG